jgi:hypothetical protein
LGSAMSAVRTRDRNAIIETLAHVVRHASQFPGLSRASAIDLVILATSWGLPLEAAKAWARSPGSAGGWTWSAASMASGHGSGVTDLNDFVSEVARRAKIQPRGTTSHVRGRKVLIPPPTQKRSKTKHRRGHVPNTPKSKAETGLETGVKRAKRNEPQPVPRPIVVSRSEPRLRGAQTPPRLLDHGPEERNPNRPAGWTTTDWINSKS